MKACFGLPLNLKCSYFGIKKQIQENPSIAIISTLAGLALGAAALFYLCSRQPKGSESLSGIAGELARLDYKRFEVVEGLNRINEASEKCANCDFSPQPISFPEAAYKLFLERPYSLAIEPHNRQIIFLNQYPNWIKEVSQENQSFFLGNFKDNHAIDAPLRETMNSLHRELVKQRQPIVLTPPPPSHSAPLNYSRFPSGPSEGSGGTTILVWDGGYSGNSGTRFLAD